MYNAVQVGIPISGLSYTSGSFGTMDIQISRDSDFPIRQQLTEQIVFLIATGRLRPGQDLPSVRALARRLKIHHNTVSQAYQDLVSRDWLVRRHGSRMMVRSAEELSDPPTSKDLDDLINETIQAARQHGYTVQQLRQRVQERLMAQSPDHILVVSVDDPGMRHLLRVELRENLPYPVEACSLEELSANRSLSAGALVTTPLGLLPDVRTLVSKDRADLPPRTSPPSKLDLGPLEVHSPEQNRVLVTWGVWPPAPEADRPRRCEAVSGCTPFATSRLAPLLPTTCRRSLH